MIDREKLETAIGVLRRWWCHGMAERFDALDKIYINCVCEAAEAHLATLPKVKTVTVWEVRYAFRSHTRWCPDVASFDSEEEARSFVERSTSDRACFEVVSFEQKVPA